MLRTTSTVGRGAPLALVAVPTLILLIALAPPPAHASCQTTYCNHQRHLRDREKEAELRSAIERNPGEGRHIEKLVALLGNKSYRERRIADHQRRYTWRPGSLGDVEADVAAERRHWAAVRARRFADDPDAQCDHAVLQADPSDRLQLLRRYRHQHPESPRLVTCLSRELESQGRHVEAIAQLRSFLDESPDYAVYRRLVDLHRGDASAVLALIEETAARLPDHYGAQSHLLEHLLGRDRGSTATERGLALARTLLARSLSTRDHRRLCSDLASLEQDELAERCWWQLHERPIPPDQDYLDSAQFTALRPLVRSACDDRDWPRVAHLLHLQPDESRADTWSSVIGFTEGDFCPHFVDAYRKGIPATEGWQIRSLARTLARCDQDALRRDLLADNDLLAEVTRREARSTTPLTLRFLGPRYGGGAVPDWSDLRSHLDAADPTLRHRVEESAAASIDNPFPWIYLATIHEHDAARAEARGADAERRQHLDAAIASWEEALERHPGDFDLVVAYGATGLRLHRPDAVRAAARKLQGRHSDPRHNAEADYLLGRLARREGRWDEASDRLISYFLQRLRYLGPSLVGKWQPALFLHLVEAEHRDRLAHYLRARNEAIDDFRQHRPPPRYEHPLIRQRLERRLQLADPDPALLTLDCTSPRALERLQRTAAAPDDPEPARLLDEALGGAICTPDELPDPEPLFPDDALLHHSWSMRSVR